jgi:dTDP-4-amino-4,6-dideoxygalactose transaminase
MPQIKMVDLFRQYQNLKAEVDTAVMAVLNSAAFIMGQSVQEFEAALAKYLEVKHVVGCASGTDALQLALMAIDIGPGDEVLTTPFTFVATVEAVVLLGGRPVFVDIEPDTFNLDPDLVERKITLRTKAMIPVHLYGHPANLEPLVMLARRHHLKIIEDAAQAIGAKYQDKFVGGWGDIGCLSFFPSKNLGAFGDAGAVLTNDDDLAGRIRLLANHGSKQRYHHEILGVNSRLDSIQAAVLNVKLRHLEDWTESRAKIAARYSAGLSGLPLSLPLCAPYARHVYNQYSIRTPRRDALARFLQERGIATAIHYPKPLHLQPAYRELMVEGERFPQSELVSQEILSLPIFPEMEETEVDFVIASIREFFA